MKNGKRLLWGGEFLWKASGYEVIVKVIRWPRSKGEIVRYYILDRRIESLLVYNKKLKKDIKIL